MILFKDDNMNDDRSRLPVAVMDSGIGGISVLKEIVKLMPHEDCIFFGDSANAPYGTKELSQIQQIVMDRAQYLYSKGIKALVVACNTATSAAIRLLRDRYRDIPVIGIEPALKPAVSGDERHTVVVMATPMTIREKKFQSLMAKYADEGTVYPLPCPGLADLIEDGNTQGEKLEKYILELLMPYLDEHIDYIVLGCTHYPFARQTIQKVAGDSVRIIDGSLGTARQLQRRLKATGLENKQSRKGNIIFEDSIPEKIQLCRQMFEAEI